MILLSDRGAVAEFTLEVMGENSQNPTHTSLWLSQDGLKGMVLAEEKMLMCVYASIFGDEV